MKHNKLFYWVASVLSLILHLGVGLFFPEKPVDIILGFYILALLISSLLAHVCGVYSKLPGSSIIDNPKTPVYKFDGEDTVTKYVFKYILPDSFLLMLFPFLMLFRFRGLEKDSSYWCITNKQIEEMNNLVKSPEEVYKECEQKSLEEDKLRRKSEEKFKLINREYYANFK